MKKILAAFLILVILTGCGAPLSYGTKGIATGAAIGGGVGALAGLKVASPQLGAAIGAGIGALTGGIIGVALDGVSSLGSAAQAAPSPRVPSAAPVQAGPWPVQPAQAWLPGTYRADPTAGEILNASRFQVQVAIDPPSDGEPGGSVLVLGPFQREGVSLDVGGHRVLGEAFAATQFGPRSVGRFDTAVQINPRHTWWRLTLRDADFR